MANKTGTPKPIERPRINGKESESSKSKIKIVKYVLKLLFIYLT